MLVRRVTRDFFIALTKRGLHIESTARGLDPTKNVDPEQLRYLETEQCLLVDEKDNFLGTASKKDCHAVAPDGSVMLHRAFSLFLFNKQEEMLMQRRSSKKVTYPGFYSNTICSHPLFLNGKQEDVKSAARRKLQHELGVPTSQVDPEHIHLLTRILYHDPCDGVWGEHEMDHILVIQGDFHITPNPDEISEIHFVSKDEFDSFISNLKGPITPWFNLLRQYRLKLWWDNLHRIKEFAKPAEIQRLIPE